MRPIKFRAWDKEFNKMIEPFRLSNLTHSIVTNPKLVFLEYTGLHDKNGKEIWEGDIVDFGRWKDGKGERATVDWTDYYCGFAYFFYSKWGGEGVERLNDKYYKKLAVVIGNVYENKELLGK